MRKNSDSGPAIRRQQAIGFPYLRAWAGWMYSLTMLMVVVLCPIGVSFAQTAPSIGAGKADEGEILRKAKPNGAMAKLKRGASAEDLEQYKQLMGEAMTYRHRGQLYLAMRRYLEAKELADTADKNALVASEIGVVLLKAKRFRDAESWLKIAYEQTKADDRARVAMELGSVNAAMKQMKEAQRYYAESEKSKDPEIRANGAMNEIFMLKGKGLPEKFQQIERDIAQITDVEARASSYLRLANLAMNHSDNKMHLVVFNNVMSAVNIAQQYRLGRIIVACYDTLSRLYEETGKYQDALVITRKAINRADVNRDHDILIKLQWRQGRLQERAGNIDAAILSYKKAVEHIENIRLDIPVVYEDGRSSFRETLEPVYLGLSNLLLQRAKIMKGKGGDSAKMVANDLIEARNAAEGIKQSELQDYLGDRCTVEAATNDTRDRLEGDTAVLYPIIFKDRVETLMETAEGLQQFSSPIADFQIRNLAYSYASALRNGELLIKDSSQSLYKALLAPLDKEMVRLGIRKVVVVPDGVLRLVPYGSLWDGRQYAIEKYAFSVSSALSLTQQVTKKSGGMRVLIAGLATPGGVVEKLNEATAGGSFSAGMADGASGATCGADKNTDKAISEMRMRDLSVFAEASNLTCTVAMPKRSVPLLTKDIEALRTKLSLPGVLTEVKEVSEVVHADVLLDKDFTVDKFSSALESGKYNVIHIASHGIFGGSGDTSYLLSYDQLITMNALQALLRSEKLVGKSIDLLSLSACETADGDDRAPLGISGAALKARAKSALGTLWPVSDDAAKQVMIDFYKNMEKGMSKTESLQKAQKTLLKDNQFENPFFWAPFILVGQWN